MLDLASYFVLLDCRELPPERPATPTIFISKSANRNRVIMIGPIHKVYDDRPIKEKKKMIVLF